jgi:hypothetical protein
MVAIDDILYDLITDKLAEIRSDPAVLEDIFAGRTNTDRTEMIKKFILENTIKVVKHHPRTAADWPCYAIVLEGTTESDQTIGESGDDYSELPISFMTDGWIGSDSLLLASMGSAWVASTAYAVGINAEYDGNSYVCHEAHTSGTNFATDLTAGKWTLRKIVTGSDVKQSYYLDTQDGRRVCRLIAKKDTSTGKGVYINFDHSVLNGGYVSLAQMANLVIRVKSNRTGSFLKFAFGENAHGEHEYALSITEKNVWERVTIDINNVPDEDKDTVKYMSFVITNDDADIDICIDEIDGETSASYVYDEIFLDHRYRIESWSNNADVTLDMTTMLLWWVLKYRTWLQNSNGLIRQRVDGADIMYQPEYIPEFAYVRGLVYSCSTIEPIPREENLARMQVRVNKIDFY